MGRKISLLNIGKRIQNKLEQNVSNREHSEAIRPSGRWARSVTWVLIVTTGLGIAWLALAETEEIIVAPGKLEPIGTVNKVQVPIGGVVEQVLVKEGERVKRNQVLLRLDQEASSDRIGSVKKTILLKQTEISLKSQELERFLELNQTEQDMLKAQLLLDKEILQRLEQLFKAGASAELQVLQQRNKTQETKGKLAQTQAERRRQELVIQQQMRGLESALVELQNQSTQARIQGRYEEIRSPVDGIVFELKSRNTGFVAQTSEPVMQIVPFDKLEARVEVTSSHIGFVRTGDRADISIDSFPATDFGVLNGTVRQIGSDALPPDPGQAGSTYRFPVKIGITNQTLRLRNGRELPLQVGMSLTANIKLRKVTYLQLLMGSFRDKANSIRVL